MSDTAVVDAPAVERPAYVPEKFWQADKGAPNVESLGKSYIELEKTLGQRPPKREVPEKYKVEKPADVNLDFKEEDILPLIETAKDLGLTQDEFNKYLARELKTTVAAVEKAQTEQQESFKKEWAKLGKDADIRVKDVKDWAKANMDEETFRLAEKFTTSADGFVLLEAMIGKTKGARLPRGTEGVSGSMSAEDLRAMKFKVDERTGKRLADIDPEYRKKVSDAYRQVYGTAPARDVV